jgi:hypothetical protein
MQLTPEQLLEEYRDTVLELHLTRRRLAVVEAENEALKAHLAPETGHTHSHGEDGEHTHS